MHAFACRTGIEPILFAALLLALSALSYSRNSLWQNELSMWDDVVRNSPGKWRAHSKFALALYNKGYNEKALKEFETALSLKPDAHYLRNNMGLAYQRMGRIEDAIR